jgi:hypothetical protein
MNVLKNILYNILVWCLLIPVVHATEPAPYDQFATGVTDTSTAPTDGSVSLLCIKDGNSPVFGLRCCPGLELNPNNNRCDEPVLVDSSLTSCTSHASCSGGKGCFPQRAGDLFPGPPEGVSDTETNMNSRETILMQVSDHDSLKSAGASCSHASECSSYSCVNSKCQDVKVCRLADLGEIASGSINCSEGQVKDSSNKCIQDSTYAGLIAPPTIIDGGMCKFEIDEESKKNALVAMQTLRAMEWFFGTTTATSAQDCFQVTGLIRDRIAKPYIENRKNILSNFSSQLRLIEQDFATLQAARANGTGPVVMHHGPGQSPVAMVESDLASRQTSGYDTLMLMYRRNILFESLERSMLSSTQQTMDALAQTYVKIEKFNEGMKTWKDNDTDWDLGDMRVSRASGCPARYRYWKLWWRSQDYANVSNLWATYYVAKGNHARNMSVVDRPNVKAHLEAIHGTNAASTKYKTSFVYLMDPQVPGVNFTSFGVQKSQGSTGFLGLGRRDMRSWRELSGEGSGSFASLRTAMKPKLVEFYKNTLKKNSTQENFVYEPELDNSLGKDCIERPTNPGCENFDAHLEKVLDTGFAQFLAWSMKPQSFVTSSIIGMNFPLARPNYSRYFNNPSSGRRKLLERLIVEMQNLRLYYEKAIELRDRQNTCIENAINGLVDGGILNNQNGGLTPGAYYGSGSQSGSGSGPGNTGPGRVNVSTRANFLFDLAAGGLSGMNNGSLMDGMGNVVRDNGGKASVDGGAAALSAMAASRQKMLQLNALASQRNPEAMAEKEKIIAGARSAAGAGNLSLAGSGLGPNALASMGAGFGSGSGTTLNQDLLKDDAFGKAQGKLNTANEGKEYRGSGQEDLGGFERMGAIGGSSEYKDPTGMSDEEKDVLMANYERNKSEYKSNEDDGIFKIVSKAYVRNLEKVLTKKKRIED